MTPYADTNFFTRYYLEMAESAMLQCDTFWSFDLKANQLAALEGLIVLDGQAI